MGKYDREYLAFRLYWTGDPLTSGHLLGNCQNDLCSVKSVIFFTTPPPDRQTKSLGDIIQNFNLAM